MPSIARSLRVACATTLLAVATSATSASAAPVTVNLRIEGSSATLYEGPITTDARTITAPDGSSPPVTGPHPCDYKDNGSNGGFGPSLGTPTTAVYDAAQKLGIGFGATWYSSQNDFFVTQVGSDVNQSSGSFASWGFAVGYTTSSVGGCQIGLSPGSDVLWAYDYFNKAHLLKLTGPATAQVGQPAVVNVTDGQSGQPISGASVGSTSTDAAGNAGVVFTSTGMQSLKASRSDSVRSNRLDVCVHNGNDGTCGTSAPAPGTATPTSPVPPPTGKALPVRRAHVTLRGLRFGQVFGRRHRPRLMEGTVDPGTTGISAVRLRLEGIRHGRCRDYDPATGTFRRRPCGIGRARWVTVGHGTEFSLLLPGALAPGRYVLDVQAVDGAGHAEAFFVPGRNRFVFVVR